MGCQILCHTTDSPGNQRHHQTSDCYTSNHVVKRCQPYGHIHSEKNHSQITDQHKERPRHKQLLHAKAVINLPCKRTDYRHSQRTRQRYQTGNRRRISLDRLYIQRHYNGRSHHNQIQKHTSHNTQSVIAIFQSPQLQKWLFHMQLPIHKKQ